MLPDEAAIAAFLEAYQKTPFAERGKFSNRFEEAWSAYYKGRHPRTNVTVSVTSVVKGPRTGYLTVTATHTSKTAGTMKTDQGVMEWYLAYTKDGLKVDLPEEAFELKP